MVCVYWNTAETGYFHTLFAVDAVYAMAHGVHNVIEEECVNNFGTSHYLCETLRPAPDGPRLLQHIRNVSFIGEYLESYF